MQLLLPAEIDYIFQGAPVSFHLKVSHTFLMTHGLIFLKITWGRFEGELQEVQTAQDCFLLVVVVAAAPGDSCGQGLRS